MEQVTYALSSLSTIEQNIKNYEDLEEGYIIPTKDIFEATRNFLRSLGEGEFSPIRINVSPNGHLVLSLGDKKKNIIIRITPKIYCLFSSEDRYLSLSGDSERAIQLVREHFYLPS